MSKVYRLREVSEITKFSRSLILKAIKEGRLKATKPKGVRDYRIREEDIEEFLSGDQSED